MTLPTTLEDDDLKVKNLTPPWQDQMRAKAKELLIDEEVRRRKYVPHLPCAEREPTNNNDSQSCQDEFSERRSRG